MRRIVASLALLIWLVGLSGAAWADQQDADEQVLMKLFGTAPITAEMFAPAFLSQASLAQILSVFDQTRTIVGAPLSITKTADGYEVSTALYKVPVTIKLDSGGRIASMLIKTPIQNFKDAADIVTAIGALSGKVAYLVTKNGEVIYAQQQTAPLAVSSGFKLGVLAVLSDEIAAGRLSWDHVVKLGAADLSLPPGEMQSMPAGSPVTVHTLAAFMISQSDNTATDALMNLVGRDKVAKKLGVDFVLTTAEFYKLKADPALRLRFASADATTKQTIAMEMSKMPLPDAGDVGAPLDAGIEWYLSSAKLCSLIQEIAGLDVFQINPGVASKADWAQIAFKGGSEVGAASLTSAVTDKSGAHYCVSVTANDNQPLAEGAITSLYSTLIAKLAGN
jgi:beta-lactamase class A